MTKLGVCGGLCLCVSLVKQTLNYFKDYEYWVGILTSFDLIHLVFLFQKTNTFPAIVLPVDLTNISYLESFAMEAVSIYGHIDILINNAGLSYRGLIVSTSTDVDYKVMLVNYLGQVALTKGNQVSYRIILRGFYSLSKIRKGKQHSQFANGNS